MRSTKAHNQSRFIRVITTPLRILCKARDLYVKSMTNCAMNVSYGPALVITGGQYYPPMPRSFSVGSSRSSNDSEDFRELVRAASARSSGHSSEIELYMEQLREQQSSVKMGSKKGLPKSCSSGMGFMGRIDEDKPCDFGAGCGVGKPELGPRSKSYAATKRKVFF